MPEWGKLTVGIFPARCQEAAGGAGQPCPLSVADPKEERIPPVHKPLYCYFVTQQEEEGFLLPWQQPSQ